MSRKPTLKSIWPFGRPKNPGFGIDRCYYMLVYSTHPVLPPIVALVNPKGDGGAVPGFGVPLDKGRDKEELGRPMTRGNYAVSSLDQKTVLRMMVMPKEETGADPTRILDSPLSANWDEEVVNRIRATWNILQFTFESHDAMVYPALDFLQSILIRAASLTDGIIADPLMHACYLSEQALASDRIRPVDAREHVGVHAAVPTMTTAGLVKFGSPEFRMTGLTQEDLETASIFLLSVAQGYLGGAKFQIGDLLGSPSAPLIITEVPAVVGIPVMPQFELLPKNHETIQQCLAAWSEGK
ncbi:MAG: hypothetical protein HONBIEJF_02696 [Fimbriimonadaceae bacterium]|nr:hypothetical protein [Fimbriimonadaceae bacterium]